MLKYIREAFWASFPVPGLGQLPVNALAIAGVTVLGFAEPSIWLLGLGLETAYLYACFTSRRFRRWVDAKEMVLESAEAEKKKLELVNQLVPPRRDRLRRLEARCGRTLQLYRQNHIDSVLAEGNQEALRRIAWYYLKLLTAQQNLEQLASETSENELRRQVQQLRADLADKVTSSTLRESKEATLRILEKRLENWTRREQSLAEIASDLTRIEAQIDLALENAGMADKTETISANMDLVSRLLDDSIYGDSGASIAEVEQSYESGSRRTGQSQ